MQFLYQITQLFERWLTSLISLASRAASSASNFYRSLAEGKFKKKNAQSLEPLHQELFYLQTSSNIGITAGVWNQFFNSWLLTMSPGCYYFNFREKNRNDRPGSIIHKQPTFLITTIILYFTPFKAFISLILEGITRNGQSIAVFLRNKPNISDVRRRLHLHNVRIWWHLIYHPACEPSIWRHRFFVSD